RRTKQVINLWNQTKGLSMHPEIRTVRNRLSLLLALLVVLVLSAFSISAQEATFTAPDGSYIVPIPAGTTNESTDEYALFTTEDGSSIYIVRVDSTLAEDEISAAAVAVALVDPEQELEPQAINDAITPKGVWKQYLYA